MTADYGTAIDEIFTVFNDAWLAGSAAIVGTVPAVYWPGLEPDAIPATEVFWTRVGQSTIQSPQATLSSRVGGTDQRRYRTSGLFFAQIFCPLSDSTAITKGRQLAALVQNAFRGTSTPSCIEFRNPTIEEVGPSDRSFQFNVVVEYRYDDIG